MSTLDKYKKVTKESTKSGENEILVSNKGDPMRHITYGTALLKDGGKNTIIVKASGAAMARAVKVALYLRKRVQGVALLTKISNREVVDEYEPLEIGLDKVTVTRKMVVLEIICSTEPLDEKNPGYKGPITQEEIDAEKEFLEKRRKESGDHEEKKDNVKRGNNEKRGGNRGGNRGGQNKGTQNESKSKTGGNKGGGNNQGGVDTKPRRGGSNKGRGKGKPSE